MRKKTLTFILLFAFVFIWASMPKHDTKGKKANDYLFDDNGKLYSNSRARDAWWNYRDEVGLSDVTPHMVRHGYATILHEAGIDPKDAQAMLGHANIQTTLDVYTHITEKQLAVTADRLNTYVNGA